MKKVFIKVPLMCLCLIGFTYQTTKFLQHYWTYPSVVNIEVEKPLTVDIPSITLCNSNSVRRTAVCKKHPEMCIKPENETEYCLNNLQNCEQGKLSKDFLIVEDVKKLKKISREDAKEMGHQYHKMIVECTIYNAGSKTECENFPSFSLQEITMTNFYSSSINCYTLFSSFKKPDRVPEKVNLYTKMRINLNAETHEYIRSKYIGIVISVHNPYTYSNPHKGGELLDIRTDNIIHMSKVKRLRLPAPFPSNCTDYMKQWRQRNGNGPTTKEMCIQECALNMTLQKHECADIRIYYPHFEKLCSQKLDNFSRDFIEPCAHVCQPECVSEEYQLSITSTQKPISEEECAGSTRISSVCDGITILLKFDGVETTTYIFSAKYEEMEILSYIGGYIGIWLGISLMAVFDFLHSSIEILKYRCRHSKKVKSLGIRNHALEKRKSAVRVLNLRRRITYY